MILLALCNYRGKGCIDNLHPERDRECYVRHAARSVLGIRHHQNAERSPSQGKAEHRHILTNEPRQLLSAISFALSL